MSETPAAKNPLVHSHDDDHHHHHHGSDSIDVLDPAQQSLSDALRVSFVILKTIMLLLLVVYCFTGVFRVDEREVAVRLRFGQIVSDGGNQIYSRGWYFGWPRPIEQVIYVPIVSRDITINDTFWFELGPGDLGKSLDELAPRRGGLNPQSDGSLLTGDANIIHAQFTVKYIITDAVAYVKHIGDTTRGDKGTQADELVRILAEEGIVRTVAQANADDLIKNTFDGRAAKQTIQASLDKLETGIKVTDVLISHSTMPLSVRAAYDEVFKAESERVTKIDNARRDETSTLNAAAGEAHEALFKLITAYDLAHTRGDEPEANRIGAELDEAFDRFEVDSLPIGGEAARILSEAKAYRTQVVEQVKAEANSFNSLLELYRKNPELVRSRLWQRAREEIFTGDVETFYVDGQIYLVTNRDPGIRKQKEREHLKEVQKNPSE